MLGEISDNQKINQITEKIIGCAISVHRGLGPGLLESAYEECLCYELVQENLKFDRQMPLPVVYKGVKLDCGYRMDLVIEDLVIIEIKAVERIIPVHEAQLLSYLKLYNKKVGLLFNFHVSVLKNGMKRIVNGF
jgi:GxxExxY protein